MTKKHYQTLEVSEKATPEDIKNSYRKLAQRWHPDKWSGRSLEEREQANEKMQEINKAYEILSDGEKRKSYDSGITDFPTDNFSYQYDPKEEIRRQEKELRRREVHVADLELEILKLEMKALDRSSTLNEIGAAFNFTFPRVYSKDLDSRLWQPYQSWGEKVAKMEVTIPKSKDRSEELKNFKEKMAKAIKEVEVTLRIRKENKKKSEHDSELNQARTVAFQEIEKSMNKKSLKVKDLEKYSSYQERINSFGEIEEIRSLREEVLGFISKLGRKESERRGENPYNIHSPIEQSNYRFPNNHNFPNSKLRENSPNYHPRSNPNPRFPDRVDFSKPESERVFNDKRDEQQVRIEEDKMDNFSSGIRDNKYDNWTHQELVNELVDEIKEKQLNNASLASLHKYIFLLETRNKELEEENKTLKVAMPQTWSLKHLIPGKKNQYKRTLDSVSHISNDNNANNSLPIVPIVGAIWTIALFGLIAYKIRKGEIKK